MPDDPADGGRREMRRQQPGAALGVLLDQPRAGAARQVGVGAGKGQPLRLGQLQLVMQHVAQEQGVLVPGAAWITTFPGVWPGAPSNDSPSSSAKSLSTSCAWPLATTGNTLSSKASRCLAAKLHGVPIVVFAPRHDVAGIGEGRHPPAVVEARVPADVVPMEMGARRISINSLRADPGRGQVGKIIAAQPMELRPGRSLPIVAEAGYLSGSCGAWF